MGKVERERDVRRHEPVEKLVEHRTAHHAAYSEASRYVTNTPAHVTFRFENPVICKLICGDKVMGINADRPFHYLPGEIMFVGPGLDIHVGLQKAMPDAPIICDCVEIEAGRFERLVERLNDRGGPGQAPLSMRPRWDGYCTLPTGDAAQLQFDTLMTLFESEQSVFRDVRIDTRIDDMLTCLMQLRTRDLLRSETSLHAQSGLAAAAALIRENLHRHVATEELLRVSALSESSLFRQFRRTFGLTPNKYAHRCRVAQVRELLLDPDLTLEQIAFDVGYSGTSHMTRTFRSVTGENPADYRRKRLTPARLPDWVPDARS